MPHIWPFTGSVPSVRYGTVTEIYHSAFRTAGPGYRFVAASDPPNVQGWAALGLYTVAVAEDHAPPPPRSIVLGPVDGTHRRLTVTPAPETVTAAALRYRDSHSQYQHGSALRPLVVELAPADAHGAPPLSDADLVQRLLKVRPSHFRGSLDLRYIVPNYKPWTSSTILVPANLSTIWPPWRPGEAEGRDLIVVGRSAAAAAARIMELRGLVGASWYGPVHDGPDRVALLPEMSDPWWSDAANARAGRRIFGEALERWESIRWRAAA